MCAVGAVWQVGSPLEGGSLLTVGRNVWIFYGVARWVCVLPAVGSAGLAGYGLCGDGGEQSVLTKLPMSPPGRAMLPRFRGWIMVVVGAANRRQPHGTAADRPQWNGRQPAEIAFTQVVGLVVDRVDTEVVAQRRRTAGQRHRGGDRITRSAPDHFSVGRSACFGRRVVILFIGTDSFLVVAAV